VADLELESFDGTEYKEHLIGQTKERVMQEGELSPQSYRRIPEVDEFFDLDTL